jgi:hypothetical protein
LYLIGRRVPRAAAFGHAKNDLLTAGMTYAHTARRRLACARPYDAGPPSAVSNHLERRAVDKRGNVVDLVDEDLHDRVVEQVEILVVLVAEVRGA